MPLEHPIARHPDLTLFVSTNFGRAQVGYLRAYNPSIKIGIANQPRSQRFSLFVIGKAGKGPGTGWSHDFQHPDIVGVINYNNNELENPRWPPTQECPQNLSA
jgi:hypothetical protein